MDGGKRKPLKKIPTPLKPWMSFLRKEQKANKDKPFREVQKIASEKYQLEKVKKEKKGKK
jgi:hypothetical protein